MSTQYPFYLFLLQHHTNRYPKLFFSMPVYPPLAICILYHSLCQYSLLSMFLYPLAAIIINQPSPYYYYYYITICTTPCTTVSTTRLLYEPKPQSRLKSNKCHSSLALSTRTLQHMYCIYEYTFPLSLYICTIKHFPPIHTLAWCYLIICVVYIISLYHHHPMRSLLAITFCYLCVSVNHHFHFVSISKYLTSHIYLVMITNHIFLFPYHLTSLHTSLSVYYNFICNHSTYCVCIQYRLTCLLYQSSTHLSITQAC